MLTRSQTRPPEPPSPPEVPPPLWTMDDLFEVHQSPWQLLQLFLKHRVLRPLYRPCPTCIGDGARLHPHADDHYTDGYRLQCSHCGRNWSPRFESVLASFETPLLRMVQLILYFDLRLDEHQAATLAGVSRNTVGKFYRLMRQRCAEHIAVHWFDYDDIVEIDELYLKPLLYEARAEDEEAKWPVVVGMIARGTNRVALEIAPDHSAESMRVAITPHLPHENTRVFTDEAKSFDWLHERYQHANSFYEHCGAQKYLSPSYAVRPGDAAVEVHTNTIEGYWSQLRTWLHVSHGWPAHYLPLFLAECMFRSLHLPLSVLLLPS